MYGGFHSWETCDYSKLPTTMESKINMPHGSTIYEQCCVLLLSESVDFLYCRTGFNCHGLIIVNCELYSVSGTQQLNDVIHECTGVYRCASTWLALVLLSMLSLYCGTSFNCYI